MPIETTKSSLLLSTNEINNCVVKTEVTTPDDIAAKIGHDNQIDEQDDNANKDDNDNKDDHDDKDEQKTHIDIIDNNNNNKEKESEFVVDNGGNDNMVGVLEAVRPDIENGCLVESNIVCEIPTEIPVILPDHIVLNYSFHQLGYHQPDHIIHER